MSKNTNGIMEKKYASPIIGIQFSILSDEEKRKGSVVEILNRETYKDNKPVNDGLCDIRMGVQDRGLICPTDGLDSIQTPGYFGHIELANPVFYIQFLNTIIKILRCICFKCSKLKISKIKYKHFLKLTPENRWSQVFPYASKIKRCGEDTDDGCGIKQPIKIGKIGFATLKAEWENNPNSTEEMSIILTPDIVLKCFKGMSDDDISFMGFSPLWSRPESMICNVLAIPPPAVRPSVRVDSHQRSEDDVTHNLSDIIRVNKQLQEKIFTNAPSTIISELTNILQFYVATLIDNKIPGVSKATAQRSNRALRTIKERLNGKHGRIRGNLMGKRVNFSARSVITPDPNIGIEQLGIPMKIAQNITKPVTVNEHNKMFLTQLVTNGPFKYPGANILEKKHGKISLSINQLDKSSINIEIGDIVHRHMMDGDAILFNRQPSLHRMSMMCHIAKIMTVGDTFRMNVADTKPYNADFDGDEMNLHMPQDPESEAELRNLAAVTWQLISPADNKTIVGIFQDSLLGSYMITRKDINFDIRTAMNLLMKYDKVDLSKLVKKNKNDKISSFELLSQIIPPLTIVRKTSRFAEEENADRDRQKEIYTTSNDVVEITNGVFRRGQMGKDVFGDGSSGLIQRICNDYGNEQSAKFIDNFQNIVTEYMTTASFSVGISDLIANKKTTSKIIQAITKKKEEVKNLTDQIHLGIFDNKTGKSNEYDFETRVNNILNMLANDTGKIGKQSLDPTNRFVVMVNAGSKGKDLNISQMMSCVGQQNVDNKRIAYGFENRTLPHFTKYDDSPAARGFVENSFISGLTPTELFFHAMGGRMGIIDTAIKTSQTGYVQRRLIKGLEDLKVEYDMTVRNNQGKIIQYGYGEDGFDPVRVEKQQLNIALITIDEIYSHYKPIYDSSGKIMNMLYTSKAIDKMKQQTNELDEKIKSIIDMTISLRADLIKNVFLGRDNKYVHVPVAFSYIIDNIKGQQHLCSNSLVDITPLDAYKIIDRGFDAISSMYYIKPNPLFKVLFYYYLNTNNLLNIKRFNQKAIHILMTNVVLMYKKAIVAPGDMVGMIAAQSVGEPTTQMTLNTFHLAGVATKSNVTRGLPRMEEILSLSENTKNPCCTVYLLPSEEQDQENAKKLIHRIEYTKLISIVEKVQIFFDPNDKETTIEEDKLMMMQFNAFEDLQNEGEDETEDIEKSKWIIRLKFNVDEMLDKDISMDDVHYTIKKIYGNQVSCAFSDYNDDNLIFRIRMNINKKTKQAPLDATDQICLLKTFQNSLLDNTIMSGVDSIDKATPRKITDSVVLIDGNYEKKVTWVVDTVGSNLMALLSLDYIDTTRTYTNNIQEIYYVMGVEAARQSILNELTEVIEFDNAYINYHHLSLLCDRMTCNDKLVSIFRHGINGDDIGPLAKASFEETPEMFLKAARHGTLDNMRGVSANVMCGQEGYFGTSAFQVVLNLDEMKKLVPVVQPTIDYSTIDAAFDTTLNTRGDCSKSNLTISNNAENVENKDVGSFNDDYELNI